MKAVSWKLLPIRSSARTALTGKVVDDVDLKHWVKIHNVPDYRFARFNKALKLLEYSDEEYAAYLVDPAWSRVETDRLMALAKQLDLRFIVMEDRYNAPALAEEHARVLGQLPQVDSAAIKAALHAPEIQRAAEQAAAADSIAIASNITLSTHPNPVTAAPSAIQADLAAVAAAADASAAGPTQMDTSADEVPAAASSAASAAASAAATSAAATAATPATDAASAGTTAAAAAAPAAPITPGTLPAAPLAPPLVSPPEPVPAVPASTAASTGALATLVSSCLSGSPAPLLPKRSVEELKSRYYFVQQTLAGVRNSSDPDLKRTNPLFTHPFDPVHELLRKSQLDRLYQRTQKQIDDMAEDVLEHRKISAQIKKIKKTQKEDRDVLRGYKSGSAVKASRSDRSGAAAGGSSTKHSKSGSSHKRGAAAAAASSMLGSAAAAQPLTGEMAPLPSSCDAALTALPHRPSGVYLRSAQLSGSLQLSSKQSKFLDSELSSLNIRRARDCTVATGVVCDLWDRLRVNILTLANLQQHVREREVMRDDLRVHSSVAGGAPGAAGAGGAAAGGAAGVPSALYNANLAQAAVMASHRKKTEKRKMEGDAEQEDKRARKK